jgi:dTDP-4-dehydrorhamnose 3,5-epimerase
VGRTARGGVEGIAIELNGVRLIELTTHSDERGGLTETFRRSWLSDDAGSIVQSNLSVSRAGVLRGMHFHARQTDYWVVLEGRAFVALIDLRPGSPTEGKLETLTVDTTVGRRGIHIPAGVAHGFYAIDDVWLQYMVDAYFTGEDEHGFAWDDPEAGIPWPVDRPIVSARDAEAPPLAAVRGQAPRFPGDTGADAASPAAQP